MSWTVTHAPLPGVLEIRLAGRLHADELRAVAVEVIAATARHACPYHLCDCTAVESGPSIFDLLGLAEDMRGLGLPAGTHLAMIAPRRAGAARDVEFWETATRNRGFDVRIFGTRELGLAWLDALRAAARSG